MSKSIPDRWNAYKPLGRVIDGTRIICFKVPLHRRVQTGNGDIKEIWDIKALLDSVPKLGAVIDLTNTSRYYDPRELQAAGVLHKKILVPGHVIPPEHKVKEFMNAVDEFLGKDCDFLVGVHCTHGLNRTGYMVCRYMRDRLNMPAPVAIKKFEKARGYKIERDNYIEDLMEKRRSSTEATSWRSECDNKSYTRARTDYRGKPEGSGYQARHRSDSDRSFDYTFDY